MWCNIAASAFFGEGRQGREIDHPGAALDYLFDLLPLGKPGNQLGKFPVHQLAHRSEFYGQVVVLADAVPASQETVEIGIGFPQELQHVKHEQLARREFAAEQPVQVFRFQPVGGEVPDPFLAIKTVRCRKVGAGNCKSDLLFGHKQLRHRVGIYLMIPENHWWGNNPSQTD
jgi:hypothetical protein